MSCPKCFSGHVNTGTPQGREEKVFGRDCYIAEPASGKEVKGIVVIITDAFGWQFVNNKILSDHYAARGDFKVYMPDFMDGTAASPALITSMNAITDDMSLTGWLRKPLHVGTVLYNAIPFMSKNKFPISWPKVTSWLEALRASPEGKLPVGAAGFCWGGKHTVNLCHGTKDSKSGRTLIDAGFTAHPSNLEVPTEIEQVILPLSIAYPEKDMAMKKEKFDICKTVLEDLSKKNGVEHETRFYEGATHGFAVRADSSKDEAQAAIEAEEQAVAFFQKHFAKVQQ